jgi:hypothetical protein
MWREQNSILMEDNMSDVYGRSAEAPQERRRKLLAAAQLAKRAKTGTSTAASMFDESYGFTRTMKL